jgi:hypothetical protein
MVSDRAQLMIDEYCNSILPQPHVDKEKKPRVKNSIHIEEKAAWSCCTPKNLAIKSLEPMKIDQNADAASSNKRYTRLLAVK